MKKNIFILLILLIFSPLYAEKKSVNIGFKLYKAVSPDDTSVYVRWMPKKIETPNLTYFFTANIEIAESPEEKEIKNIFNLKELKVVREGEFKIPLETYRGGKSKEYMIGYWERVYGIRGLGHQITLSDGKKYEFRLILLEPSLDAKRFRFQVYEPPKREVKEGGIAATIPDKFYLDVEFLIPDKSSTVIGFVDSKDTPYFASFHRIPKKVEGAVIGVERGVGGVVVGGIVGGVSMPAGTEKRKEPIPIREGIKPPRLIKKVEPVYPENCVKEGIEGVVILEATTDENGNVVKAEILHHVHTDLDKAAVEAVKQWKYAPFIFEGEPRSVIFTVTVSFKLAKDEKEMEAINFVNIVYPDYPEDCPEKIKGIVEIKANIDKEGNVTGTILSKSLHPCLDKHAMERVKKWIESEEGKKIIRRTSKPCQLFLMVQFMHD